MDYKRLFNDANILDIRTNIPWEFVRYPFWWKIRNLYVEYIKNELEKDSYEEWHFTDFLWKKWVEKMDNYIMSIKDKLYPISNISSNWTKLGEYYLAPTHEISVSEAMNRYIKYDYDLPIKLFHIWSAFRKQYNSSFPFWLSKRNTYIECHNIQKTKEWLYNQLDYIISINKNILWDFLLLPYIESIRPYLTNNPVSKKTIWMDILTPMNKTLHAWMIYIQEDIFTKVFWVEYYDINLKSKVNPYVIHYWFTDNLLMASIIHWFNLGKWKKIILPHWLMPYHISITTIDNDLTKFLSLFWILKLNWFRFEIIKSFPFWHTKNKTIIQKLNIQNPYIHIKWIDALWFYTYRIIWENLRLKWNEETIIKIVDILKEKRKNYMEVKKIQILKDRIIETKNISEINKLISEWYIIDVYLQDDKNTILSMEKFINWWEILWYRNCILPWKCIFTWKKSLKKAYLSKRI